MKKSTQVFVTVLGSFAASLATPGCRPHSPTPGQMSEGESDTRQRPFMGHVGGYGYGGGRTVSEGNGVSSGGQTGGGETSRGGFGGAGRGFSGAA